MDAGIGRPSQACEAMEMGAAGDNGQYGSCDGGRSHHDGRRHFRQAIEAGRKGFLAGLGRVHHERGIRLRSSDGIPERLRRDK